MSFRERIIKWLVGSDVSNYIDVGCKILNADLYVHDIRIITFRGRRRAFIRVDGFFIGLDGDSFIVSMNSIKESIEDNLGNKEE